ncbi:Na(+)/H(+) antiporter subunit B [Arsenicitalea aurantiaca]|uniref:Na(+)/H(+) antiporter subunit B n=1 Tax=Arsenicitalea aurantiaca TaxID=1783274 RepID=A0A433XAF9_9HYPH|nr:MnhB domain-containing protein [Arsenicitalea aurantiaca]RUT31034.1 Na(+)/H(+) antiporter subunit B [Arsenicitalea aurantiaca]
MNTLIFRTIAPLIVAVMVVFSIFITLRGHNEPGGGFIGGLIAAAALAILSIATSVQQARRSLHIHPLVFAGFGVFMAGVSGMVSMAAHAPFLTGLWLELELGEAHVALSTPLFFDLGVYLAVFGALGAVILGLETDGEID